MKKGRKIVREYMLIKGGRVCQKQSIFYQPTIYRHRVLSKKIEYHLRQIRQIISSISPLSRNMVITCTISITNKILLLQTIYLQYFSVK